VGVLADEAGFRWRSRNQVLINQMFISNAQSIGELLDKWNAGEREALNSLVPLIYNELHGLAHYYLQGERTNHTLQTTALVNEAYLRLARQGTVPVQNREHFVAMSARLMRQILVDYARGRRAGKRGGDCNVEFDENMEHVPRVATDVIALDDSLTRLAQFDPQQSLIVELRFFGGMTLEETAAVLGVSLATAKRDWSMARAWLYRDLSKDDNGKRAAVGQG
jgi:RNA polymerase sigma factor (TIGR02999 family)